MLVITRKVLKFITKGATSLSTNTEESALVIEHKSLKEKIVVYVVKAGAGQCRIGVSAESDTKIYRGEVWEALHNSKLEPVISNWSK